MNAILPGAYHQYIKTMERLSIDLLEADNPHAKAELIGVSHNFRALFYEEYKEYADGGPLMNFNVVKERHEKMLEQYREMDDHLDKNEMVEFKKLYAKQYISIFNKFFAEEQQMFPPETIADRMKPSEPARVPNKPGRKKKST